MKRLLIAALATLGLLGPALAHELDDAIVKFIAARGFEHVDAGRIERELDAFWLDLEVVSPGGWVGPIEKALLTATNAIPSTRTRTALSYGEMVNQDMGPVSFIEVRHYNLGPQIRRDAIADYGADTVGSPQDFGIGDHMAWRFVLAPMMNNSAIVLYASNRVISDQDAADDQCTGRPCLDLATGFDEIADWDVLDGTAPEWTPYYPDTADGLATPAHAIAQLAVIGFWASAESGSYQWTGGEHPEAARNIEPYRFIGIDRNLGQDTAIDSVWRETLLNDHELSAIAFRRIEFDGVPHFMRASERY